MKAKIENCPKCESDDFSRKYQKLEFLNCNTASIPLQFLRCECSYCGYTWAETCADFYEDMRKAEEKINENV